MLICIAPQASGALNHFKGRCIQGALCGANWVAKRRVTTVAFSVNRRHALANLHANNKNIIISIVLLSNNNNLIIVGIAIL